MFLINRLNKEKKMINSAQIILEQVSKNSSPLKGSLVFSQNASKEATGLGIVLESNEKAIDVYLFNMNSKIEFVLDQLGQYVSKNKIEDSEDLHVSEEEVQKNRFYGYHLTHYIKNNNLDLELQNLEQAKIFKITLHTPAEELWQLTELNDEKIDVILDLYEGKIFSQTDRRPKKL